MATYRKRGKKWECRVFYIDSNGVHKQKSKSGFATKAEAKVYATNLENELNKGMDINQGDRIFSEYYKEWIDTYKIGRYTLSTDNYYKNALKLIKKYFPNKKIKELTRIDYQNFLNDYGQTHSKATVKKTHTKISACLKQAFNDGHIPTNPTYKVTLTGKDGQNKVKFLQKHEAEKLLVALLDGLKPNYITRYMLILQLATGMRISEIMALKFTDIDFRHQKISVTKSWDYKDKHDFAPTKNGESRIIAVDQKTLNIIRPFFNYQKSQTIQDNKQRLFAHKGNIPSTTAVNKALKRACKRADINVVTSHALRHTHASILLLDGVNLAYISQRLGHKDISVTSDVYSHVLQELRAKEDSNTSDIFSSLYLS